MVTIYEDHNPIAFPATISVRSWADVVRHEIQPTGSIITNDLVMLRSNDTSSAAFIADTLVPSGPRPCSTQHKRKMLGGVQIAVHLIT